MLEIDRNTAQLVRKCDGAVIGLEEIPEIIDIYFALGLFVKYVCPRCQEIHFTHAVSKTP